MEAKIAKASDRGRRVMLGVKNRRATRYASYYPGVNHRVLQKRPILSKVGKRKKLHGCRSKLMSCGSHFRRSLLAAYSNFTRSGVPQRLMFYQNGQWNDFPQVLVDSVRKELQLKKAAVKIESNGGHFLLDFLHMFHLDLKTGVEQPIAWIDDAGSCFFPEIYNDDDDDDETNGNWRDEGGKEKEPLFEEHSGSREIKLHLEIEINGIDQPEMKECSGESNDLVKKIKIDRNLASNRYAMEVENSCNGECGPKVDENVEDIQEMEKNSARAIDAVNKDTVRNMFFKGMSTGDGTDLIDIYQCSSNLMQSRLELFLKQVEITKTYRGDANVRYAWLASSKRELSTIMMYGLGHCGLAAIKSNYGTGVHLSAASFSNTCARYCDVDENGVRHMLYCRVIMGNMELLYPGSKQCLPGSKDFDSGVDDLQDPKHFIVWNMNMNTHIYPEFVVSFKVSSNGEGYTIGSENKLGLSGVATSCQGPHQVESSAFDRGSKIREKSDCGEAGEGGGQLINVSGSCQEKTTTAGSTTHRGPRSPWMPFSMLFAAIANEIPPKDMEQVNIHFDLFKSKKMNRAEFINQLRSTVGDSLLRSTIAELQCKIPMCRNSHN